MEGCFEINFEFKKVVKKELEAIETEIDSIWRKQTYKFEKQWNTKGIGGAIVNYSEEDILYLWWNGAARPAYNNCFKYTCSLLEITCY
jgi:hypothetical protein